MLINLFLKKEHKLNYKNIEKYSYLALFLLSSYVTYNIQHYEDVTPIIDNVYYYILLDSFFIPSYKKDTIFHHFVAIFLYNFTYYNKLPFNIVNYIGRVFLSLEVSSIFLSSTFFLKNLDEKYDSKLVKYTLNINYICLLITFFKYRCINVYLYFLQNDELYVILNNYGSNSMYIIYPIGYLFWILNLYWFSLLMKIIFKKL